MVKLIIFISTIFIPLWCDAQFKKFLLNKDIVLFKDHVNKVGKNYQHVGYIDEYLKSSNEFTRVNDENPSPVSGEQLVDRRRRKSTTAKEHKIIDPFVFTFVTDKVANDYSLNSDGYGISLAKEIFEDYSKKHNITYLSAMDKDVRFKMFVQTLKLMHDDVKQTAQVRSLANTYDNDNIKHAFLTNNRNKRQASRKFEVSWTSDIQIPLKEQPDQKQIKYDLPSSREFANSWMNGHKVEATERINKAHNDLFYGNYLDLGKAREIFEDYADKYNRTFKNEDDKYKSYELFVTTLKLNKIMRFFTRDQHEV